MATPAEEPAEGEQEAPPPTLDEMKQQLAAALPVSEKELEALAHQRAETVRDYLLKNGMLSNERVFLLDGHATTSGHDKVRTELTIEVASVPSSQ